MMIVSKRHTHTRARPLRFFLSKADLYVHRKVESKSHPKKSRCTFWSSELYDRKKVKSLAYGSLAHQNHFGALDVI